MTGHVDNLWITAAECQSIVQHSESEKQSQGSIKRASHRSWIQKKAWDVSQTFLVVCIASEAAQDRANCRRNSKLTCHRFSRRDDGGEDDASCDRLYDDPWDAFSYGVNRALEPPKSIFAKIKNQYS
jgi:hypothetical protein